MSDYNAAGHNSVQIDWKGEPISVVSLGCDRLSALTPLATEAIRKAQVIFGSEHHFSEIDDIDTQAEKIVFTSPFSELGSQLDAQQSKRVVVLASGDALYFGVGKYLTRIVGSNRLTFHPNISSVQACFHALGLPWQDARVVSVHGRPLNSLRRHLASGRLIACLTDAKSNPIAIARELQAQGFAESRIWVCEAMGSPHQRVGEYAANELAKSKSVFDDLNVCVMQLSGKQALLPSFPGIADHLFSTGAEPGFGMISKREVRLTILSLMQPTPGEVAWDIGAGCGSVSVEWAHWNEAGHIYAIENDRVRIGHIKINSERFGTDHNLSVIEASAPAGCEGLPDPDCIFIGGSRGLDEMLEYAWRRLRAGGKLVASAVTESSRRALAEFIPGKYGLEQVDIQVSKNLPQSQESRTLKPVLVVKCIKSNDNE
ncbi:MAG: precorrin-6y C5,15-methyltransferase (decarboxylating) subunit CbiE [Gammaproteobacteria bacterium]